MPEKDFSIGDAVNFGWYTMKTNLGFFIPAVLIIWGISAVPSGFQWVAGLADAPVMVVLYLLLAIISLVVGIFLSMAQIRIGLRYCSGEKADFPDLVSSYPRFGDFLLGSILFGLIVFAGFILLIIPGIYWGVRYRFFGYYILDRDMKPVEAIKASGRMTRGVWWHLFVFWLAMFGIRLLGILACCVGLLFAVPVEMVSIAYVYRALLAVTPEPAA